MKKFIFSALAILLVCPSLTMAQKQLTREQILSMTTDELSDLPLDELMAAVETLGVSSVDELFNLIMNKNVSSASKHEESSFTSPLATTVITQEEIHSYGCSTIEEAFRLIPGMIVAQKTNGVYDVQMRGLNNVPDNNMLLYTESNNTLLMVDGRVLHSYSIGAMSMENLPIGIGDIERIEVVRGACSALYGVNAVNGVINIITRKPDTSSDVVSGSYQMGNQGTFVGDIALRKALNDKVAAGISFNIQQRERPTDKLRTYFSGTHYIDRTGALELGTSSRYTQEQIDEMVSNGTLIPVEPNELISLDDMNALREVTPSALLSRVDKNIYNALATVPQEYANVHDVFPDPSLARKTLGLNGYLTITPNSKVRFDLTGGYSHNHVAQTTLVINPYSFNQRKFKKGYFNLSGDIHDFHFMANYCAGPEDFALGRPGFQVKSQQVFASAAYDVNVGNTDTWGSMAIRPGVSYQYLYAKDVYSTFNYGGEVGEKQLPGFFNGDAELWAIAPSLRLDYYKGDFRLTLAARSDKTHIPDKWNTSYTVAANYQLNSKNFIRFVFGRGIRSANLVNTSVGYMWSREKMSLPREMYFQGKRDGNIVHADNYEIGYRIQPTPALLIDAEAFYSYSKGYGALSAANSEELVNISDIVSIYSAVEDYDLENRNDVMTLMSTLPQIAIDCNFISRNYIEYQDLPYKVHQLGIGANIDWIITPKLVAKLNANVQRTWIDNYYPYSLLDNIAYQLQSCVTSALTLFPEAIGTMKGYDYAGGGVYTKSQTTRTLTDFVRDIQIPAAAAQYRDMYDAMSEAEKNAFTQKLRQGWLDGNDVVTIDGVEYQTPLTLYYALKYNVDVLGSDLLLGESQSVTPTIVNKHKHKATPSIYGMFGLVYKPLKTLNVSAYGNFIGKRNYQTIFGEQQLDPRFTLNLKVGYKPVDGCEVFVNANNLFNKKKQEFVFSDEIGGIYTVGVNFNF